MLCRLTSSGSMKFWGMFFWFLHIAFILITVLLPGKPKPAKKAEGTAT